MVESNKNSVKNQDANAISEYSEASRSAVIDMLASRPTKVYSPDEDFRVNPQPTKPKNLAHFPHDSRSSVKNVSSSNSTF